MPKCCWACDNLHGVLSILCVQPWDVFCREAWQLYPGSWPTKPLSPGCLTCILHGWAPKSQISSWTMPLATSNTCGMEKSLSLCLDMAALSSGVFSAYGLLLLQSTVSQSESGLFNRSDLVFLQLSAPTIQRKINGMRCEEAETGKVSLSPCECTVSQIANNQLYHYTRPIFT